MIFRNWVLQNFPFLEDDFDALTDYELFCKMMEYVKQFAKNEEEFKQQLAVYENYFENLDVQEEIDNKLDEMALDGTLEEIITSYIQLKGMLTFDTVSAMKSATNLIDGSFAQTLGFNSVNDGGGSIYKITDDGTANEKDVIACQSSLKAHLITSNYIAEKFGAHADGETDDTLILQIQQYYLKKHFTGFLIDAFPLFNENSLALKDRPINEQFTDYCIVQTWRKITSKKGNTVYLIEVDFAKDRTNILCFENQYEENKNKLTRGNILEITCDVTMYQGKRSLKFKNAKYYRNNNVVVLENGTL